MNLKAFLLALTVIVIWGSNFIVIKMGVEVLPPFLFLTFRFALAGLLFIPFMKWPGWHKATQIASIGLFMGLLHQGFLYMALQEMSVSLMSVILQSQVIFVVLIGWLGFKETIGWRTCTGILIAILGISILLYDPNAIATPKSWIFAFASAFFVAFAYIMMKKVDMIDAPTYMALLHLPIVPFMLLSSFIFEGTQWFDFSAPKEWNIIIFVVLYQAIILSFSHILWQRLMSRYPMTQVVPLTLLVPFFGIIFAMIFLDEALTSAIVIGGLLTVLGVAVITFRRLKKI